MRYVKGMCCIASVAMALFGGASVANAQEDEVSQQLLLQRIQALEEQIQQLKSQVQELEGKTTGRDPRVGERITQIEQQIEETEEKAANDFRVYWKDSLRFETEDGRYKLRIGGRIQSDFAWYDQDDNLRFLWNPDSSSSFFRDEEDGVEFRRARVYLSGDVYDNIAFKAQYDFAGGDADFKDVYIKYKNIPGVGAVQVGQFKEPFSLDELTSSNHITFMERALPNVFAPARKTGIMIGDQYLDERVTWAAGVFKDVDSFGDGAEDGEYNYTLRFTGLPWYKNEGRELVHLGVSYSHRNPDDLIRYRQRPEAHQTARFVDTGRFWADDVDLWGLEAAGVYGPFSLQSEYMLAETDTLLLGDRDLDGWYVFGSYFLTGENRGYKTSGGTFDGVTPNNDFNLKTGGWGAWELALRYSELDLNDGFIRGGEEENVTVGLNWYLNKATKIMFNYVMADIDHDLYGGDLDIFQTRFQFQF